MREVTLPSGAILKVAPAPFADALALNEAVMRVLRGVPVNARSELGEALKSMCCDFVASPEVKRALAPCMARCMYGGLKIDDTSFEAKEKRGDYYDVVYEVAKENLEPFLKSLYARFVALLPKAVDATQT